MFGTIFIYMLGYNKYRWKNSLKKGKIGEGNEYDKTKGQKRQFLIFVRNLPKEVHYFIVWLTVNNCKKVL